MPRALIALLLTLTLASPHVLAADVTREKTDEALQKIETWDAEERMLEKRAGWEMPLGLGVIIAAMSLISHDMRFVYAGGATAAAGLTVHFTVGRSKPVID